MILRIRRSLQIRGAAKEERHKTKKKAAVNSEELRKVNILALLSATFKPAAACVVSDQRFSDIVNVQERKNTKTNATFASLRL